MQIGFDGSSPLKMEEHFQSFHTYVESGKRLK